MKTRISFVSNSSSCSFMIMTNAKTIKELEKVVKLDEKNISEVIKTWNEYREEKGAPIEDLDELREILVVKIWEQIQEQNSQIDGVKVIVFDANNESKELLSFAAYCGALKAETKSGKIKLSTYG